jgi:hypothetical protein
MEREEIHTGTRNNEDMNKSFTQQELEKAQGTNLAYTRAWLRNVRAWRRRERLHDESQDMQSLRRNIHRFLNKDKE